MSETILYSESGHIGRVTLNIPERHNALSRVELDVLKSLFENIAAERRLRVLLLEGSGEKTFCAGASLDELGAGALSDDRFQQMTQRLSDLYLPTICALNGNVFGGGVELAASCDFRLGIAGMRMRVPAARLGLCYPLPGIERLVECLGTSAARRILVASEDFEAAELLRLGFLDRLVEPALLEEESTAMAEHIASLAPLSVQGMKSILRDISRGTLDEEDARQLVQESFASEDLQEGLKAMREKRAPAFKGS